MSDMAMTSTRSAYLEGNYGPVREEVTVTTWLCPVRCQTTWTVGTSARA